MKISVIIPCHNAERYLAQTIGSVIEQFRPADEILVVDDKSTDGSVEVACRFGSRVTVVQTAFGSATQARNTGFSMASGDAFMFLDADDVLGPDVLRGLERALHDQPDAVAMCEWKRLELEEGRWQQRPASVPDFDPAYDRLGNWLLGHYTPPCAVLWSKEAYQRTGGWDERALVNNDGDIMMRAMLADVPIVDAQEGTAYYRRLPKGEVSLSGTRTSTPGLVAGLYVLKKIAAMMEEQGLTERYRTPISAELDRIESAASEPPSEIKQLCASLRELYGENPAAAPRRQRKQIVAAKLRAAGRRMSGSRDQPSPDPSTDREIRFGLVSSERDLQLRQSERTEPHISEVPQQPRVSVIIPTFNRKQAVMRALKTVLGQTFTDFEVLVVDDGSTDGTAAKFAEIKDKRIIYLPQTHNQGVSAARNRGLREARGQYVAFLDSDDEWRPQMLAKQVERLEASPSEVGLVYTGVESIGPDGQRETFQPHCKGDLRKQFLRSNCIHSGSGVMIRRNVIRVAGFFDEGIPAIEDFEYWLRIARFYNFEFVAEPLVVYHDAADPTRKSLAQDDNRAARKWLYNKHRREMQREEVAHLFLMDSAIRQWQQPDSGAKLRAMQLAAQAIAAAPRRYAPYSVFVRVVTPEPLHSGLRKLRPREPPPPGRDSNGPPTPEAVQTPNSQDHANPQKRLKVCQFVLLSGVRSETFLRAHMEALPHDVRSVAIGAWDKPALQEDEKWIFPQTRIGRSLRSVSREPVRKTMNKAFQRSLEGYLRREKFDCVLAEYGPVGAVVAQACANAGVPLIVHFHGFDAHLTALVQSLAEDYQRLFKTAVAVVAVSRKMEASLVELGCPQEKIHLIPCGVDVHTFHQGTGVHRSSSAPFHFVFVGRFVNKKGPLHLLLAFSRCLEHTDARLTMVGDGELTEVTLEVAQALGFMDRVNFPGGRSHEEVMSYLAGADCYVQHSIEALSGDCEGSPVSIIEAEAMGLPVIATRHAGIIDSVVDGVTGFLVEEGDIEAMGDRMAHFVEHPDEAARMGLAGREHVIRNYSMEVVSARLSRLLTDCCSSPRHRINNRVFPTLAVVPEKTRVHG